MGKHVYEICKKCKGWNVCSHIDYALITCPGRVPKDSEEKWEEPKTETVLDKLEALKAGKKVRFG
jgi:hypothetical protein